MKILIVTAAGMSMRFSKSIGRTCLKCLYYQDNIRESLLWFLLHQEEEFDQYIIVGGFMFDELCKAVQSDFYDLNDKIILMNNEEYCRYGSGYSLYIGLKTAIKAGFDELIFLEGDLFFDQDSFQRIYDSPKSVITSSPEEILADKAVVFYFNKNHKIHYIYDTNHSMLEIREPFLGVFNSGQVWKFSRPDLVKSVFDSMDQKEWEGTNLVFVEKYFQSLNFNEYEIIRFSKWINCNTISDFQRKMSL